MQPSTSGRPQVAAAPAAYAGHLRPVQRAVWRRSGLRQPALSPATHGARTRRVAAGAAAADTAAAGGDCVLRNGLIDYYELLGVDDTAPYEEIKGAWRSLHRVCHVDIAGDQNHNVCILLNEAYQVLSQPQQRTAYNQALDAALADADDGYTGQPLSKWMAGTKMGKNADLAESRAVFVDEVACIGCKQCVFIAPATFRLEAEHGRSRVFGQWLDTEDDTQAAIDSCPVSCIHWVDRSELAGLEFVCQTRMPRTNVGMMMAGQGGPVEDAWSATAKYMKERDRKEEQRARAVRQSAAAEAARRAAAEQLMHQQQGWFTTMAFKFGISNLAADAARAMDEAVYGSGSYYSSSDDEYSGYQRVGRRQRSRRQAPPSGARNAEGGRVAPDRALVPSTAAQQPWERRRQQWQQQ